ncbi:hypothetical protein [Nocardia sp. CS682]|uniref:hypothetical protein n=1 Tax=Nocardia sp. CS682 TaxID=1047172 RepID=UPI0010752DC8|nr:hypothetical protein [Nocardia sp. CS682]
MTLHNISGKRLRLGAKGILASVAATMAIGPVQTTIAYAEPDSSTSAKDLIIKAESNKRQYRLSGQIVWNATDAEKVCEDWGGKLANYEEIPDGVFQRLKNILKVKAETIFIAPEEGKDAQVLSFDSEGGSSVDGKAEAEARVLCEKPLG